MDVAIGSVPSIWLPSAALRPSTPSIIQFRGSSHFLIEGGQQRVKRRQIIRDLSLASKAMLFSAQMVSSIGPLRVR
jgi:hypothetical protein